MFNISKNSRAGLTPLEQVVMDFVWAHPGCTAEACREGLASERPLKDSTIRTILRHLEEKGYITHTVEGRTFVYRASETPRNVAAGVVAQLVDRFCGGSVEELIVGLVDQQMLKPQQLRDLAAKIAARKEQKR
jgi:BlaI family transcriptional regulator, penicillinase repressor